MAAATEYDAVVVGTGPNGLAAACALAEAGASVLAVEGADTVGGGCRSAELTLPGFVHDVCSAVHPMAVASPYFRTLPLDQHGLEWLEPDVQLAHPLDDGSAAVLLRSVDDTGVAIGDPKGWDRIMGPVVRGWDRLLPQILGPPLRAPRHPVPFLRFGLRAPWPASLVSRTLGTPQAAALFAGIAAHSIAPLTKTFTAAAGVMLGGAGHAVGWPVARGGSQRIADALAAHLGTLGGKVETGRPVRSLDELPSARATLLDVTPWQLVDLAGERLPEGARRRLMRFRHGAASFKVDYALDGPVPWRAEACRRAGTVHVGGTVDEMVEAEGAVAKGRIPERPFLLVAQQSVVDPSRAPEGKHTLWAYCHVPFDSKVDMTGRIDAQLERFAPGFKDRVLARSVLDPAGLHEHDPNYIGGDIAGGATNGLQLLFRPSFTTNPYATAIPGVFLCSSSTPPAPGVHGMCGWWAAQAALRTL